MLHNSDKKVFAFREQDLGGHGNETAATDLGTERLRPNCGTKK